MRRAAKTFRKSTNKKWFLDCNEIIYLKVAHEVLA
jgi:hypothetical protein